MNISNSIYDFDLIKKCTDIYGIPFIYIFTNFLCIDCPAKYKNFGQTQQQVTRSLCNLGKGDTESIICILLVFLSSVNNVTCDCTVCIMLELVNYLEEDLSNLLWSCFEFSHSELSCL